MTSRTRTVPPVCEAKEPLSVKPKIMLFLERMCVFYTAYLNPLLAAIPLVIEPSQGLPALFIRAHFTIREHIMTESQDEDVTDGGLLGGCWGPQPLTAGHETVKMFLSDACLV